MKLWLWLVILLEFVSPVPAVLTLGAIYVMLFRPPGFPALVDRLYQVDRGDPDRPKPD